MRQEFVICNVMSPDIDYTNDRCLPHHKLYRKSGIVEPTYTGSSFVNCKMSQKSFSLIYSNTNLKSRETVPLSFEHYL